MGANPYVGLLSTLLFEKDQRRLTESLQSLIEQNYALGNPREGFLLSGAFHSLLTPRQLFAAPKKILHTKLIHEGREYIEDVKRCAAERSRLEQGLSLLLQPCYSDQDIRDALPDTVVFLCPELSRYPRTREEGWTFENRPLQLHQHQEIKTLLEFYVANRILS